MKLKLGWWYIRYLFTFHPMEAFGIFADEYRRQTNDEESDYADIAVDIYPQWEYYGKTPQWLVLRLIAKIALIVFKIRLKFEGIRQKCVHNKIRKMYGLPKKDNTTVTGLLGEPYPMDKYTYLKDEEWRKDD